ncbi:MAG: L,D-transpeptidase family protein [Thermoleophilaceae bacterium]
MRRIAIAGLVGGALAAAPAYGASTPPATTAPAPTPPAQPQYVELSNETTTTRWAYTNLTLKVRSKPAANARKVAKLHFNTEDGPPEVYIALQEFTNGSNVDWVQVRIPGRPNGRKGWVPREGLGEFHTLHTQLIIDRRTLRATLFKNGKKIFKAPVGVGKGSTPTPGGHFWIREKLLSLRSNPAYGPLAFGTAAYSTKLTDWPGGGVVGVHGTNEPNLVPGRPSHGCVRMHNRDIVKLAKLLKTSDSKGWGTPVWIK